MLSQRANYTTAFMYLCFKSIMYRLTFCHTTGIAIISEVTEMSNTIILCTYYYNFFTRQQWRDMAYVKMYVNQD